MSVNDDPALAYEQLRDQTAHLLGLDLAALSPVDGLRLDLTAMLRLSLDALQGAALAGRDVDLSRLQACYAMLAKLLPQAVEAAPQMREGNSARRRLAALLDGISEVDSQDKDEQIAELQTLLAEKTAALTALLGSPPAVASPEPAPAPPAPPKAPAAQTSRPPSSAPPAAGWYPGIHRREAL